MPLELSLTTWVLFGATIGLWGFSIHLAKERFSQKRFKWTIIPFSLFGLAWIAFGINFISRFLFLVYDPVLFCATRLPIWHLPVEVFNSEWIFLAAFWAMFCLGFFTMVRWMPHNAPKMLKKLDQLVTLENVPLLDAMALTTGFLLLLTKPDLLPPSLATPFGHLGRFFVIPAMAAWFLHFKGKTIGLRRFLYLVPGVILYVISPYRAHLVIIAICVLLPALQTRRWVSFKKIFLGTLILLVVSTAVTDYYREKFGMVPKHIDSIQDRWESWQEVPEEAPWVRLVNRFHGFDSLGITIYFVPSFFPYSNLNIFTDMLVRIVPRAIWDTKPDTHRGRDFSASIWAMDEKRLEKRPEANISPSMCADLYMVQGIYMIVLGALIYGLIVGLLESWRRAAGPLSSCTILVAFGIPVAMGIEQEFSYVIAGIFQYLIVLFSILLVINVRHAN